MELRGRIWIEYMLVPRRLGLPIVSLGLQVCLQIENEKSFLLLGRRVELNA